MSMSSKDFRKAGGAPVPPVVAQQAVEPAVVVVPEAKSEPAQAERVHTIKVSSVLDRDAVAAPAPSAKPKASGLADLSEAPSPLRELATAAKAEAPAATAAPPSVPTGHVLARWTGKGTFAGRCYSFPSGKELPCAKGPTLAYFDEASVRKLGAPTFEVHQATAGGGTEPVKALAPAAAPPEGHVLARWTGAGRFAGGFITFPERAEKPYAQGPTVGYFPAASVKKLGKLFEIL